MFLMRRLLVEDGKLDNLFSELPANNYNTWEKMTRKLTEQRRSLTVFSWVVRKTFIIKYHL